MDEKERIVQLRKEVNRYNYHYYVLSDPLVDDFFYDIKLRELQVLEAKHPELYDPTSPTQRVGSDLSPKNESRGFIQREHTYPMLSLANTYSQTEIEAWFSRLPQNIEIICELKYDGLSISLHYENHQLVYALTRGDGQMGDDVTENVKTISAIPQHLPDDMDIPSSFEMRGEVLLPWKNFEALNRERIECGESPFANPRNAASGTLKLLDTQEVKKRKLTAILYYMLGKDLPYDTHYERMQYARSIGFPTSDAMKVCRNIEEVMAFINFWDKERYNLPVATDGIVLKINDIKQQESLGFTAKTPKWAIAFKFRPEQQQTQLLKISYQVGRTGIVTPVAILNPISLAGTVVKRATLHNENFIRELNLQEGDIVMVEKGGEIIPKITSVVKHREGVRIPYQFPEFCPQCGTKLIRPQGEVAWYCPNEYSCPSQQIFKILHFVHRRAMNIEGLGYETIVLLYNKKIIRNIADLYNLKVEDIACLEGFGEKSAKQIIQSIEKSKTVEWKRVLFALGIRMVGETTAAKTAKKFPSLTKLEQASFEQLITVEDIGDQIAKTIIEFFKSPVNIAIIERLKGAGLRFENEGSHVLKTQYLLGQKIIISGTFSHHSRDDYKRIIEDNGGVNVSSISKSTTMLLRGENMGESKRQKALELGIPMIDEIAFLEMIHSNE